MGELICYPSQYWSWGKREKKKKKQLSDLLDPLEVQNNSAGSGELTAPVILMLRGKENSHFCIKRISDEAAQGHRSD